MEENRGKTDRRLENLKTDAGPGRPKGQRNYATIYREALIKIAATNNKTPEEIEEMMEQVGLQKALKGDFAFFKDVRDRIHGKPTESINHNVQGGLVIEFAPIFKKDETNQ